MHIVLLAALNFLAITVFLGFLSGWYELMRLFPDQPQASPLAKLRWESGRMGWGVSLRSVLKLDVCDSGLRVGLSRIIGPFWPDFFVPWESIRVARKKCFWWEYAELSFGESSKRLGIPAHLADRIWRIAPQRWPEKGSPPPPEPAEEAFKNVLYWWLTMTPLVSAALLFVPPLITHSRVGLSATAAVSIAAFTCGLNSYISFQQRRN